MELSAIGNGLSSIQGVAKAGSATQSENRFSNILSEAVDNIKETEAAEQAANNALLTGESDDIHTALIAAQKAEVAVSYAVQIRNKLIESYDKIMNMQV
jgi:flagellar hook-basal body complex protein FliE